MLDWHARHGGNVSLTARHFGYSRPTVYRWLGRYDRLRLETLEDRPSRPVRRRRPTWTLRELDAVRRLRIAYPRWGKDKLAVLLRREGLRLSVSMVGRILERLRRTGELREPRGRRISARKRSWRRPHAVRKPARLHRRSTRATSSRSTRSTCARSPGVVLKQFTARDVVSRWDVLELRSTATLALGGRDPRRAGRPDAVRGPGHQVDNGSEFMAEFEAGLRGPGDRPARRCRPAAPSSTAPSSGPTAPTPRSSTRSPTPRRRWRILRPALLDWETTYNTVRPHQALGYLTPAEYLASLEPDV